MEIFRKEVLDFPRIVYFDLDTVILSNIDDLLTIDSDFVALKPWNPNNRSNGWCASGMMGWKNDGSYSFLYDGFDIDRAESYRKGDLEYISKALVKEGKHVTFYQDVITGIYSYKRNCRDRLPKNAKVICFHGKPRVHRINDSWVVENWR